MASMLHSGDQDGQGVGERIAHTLCVEVCDLRAPDRYSDCQSLFRTSLHSFISRRSQILLLVVNSW
jgi:hypothetical protein